MPDFDQEKFPFVVSYARYSASIFVGNETNSILCDSFDLINTKTGQKEPLIMGSANNLKCQEAAFFVRHSPTKFEFNFCTAKLNEDNLYEHYWNRADINADFIDILKTYGSLPLDSVQDTLDMRKGYEELKTINEELQCENGELKASNEKIMKEKEQEIK